MVVETTSLATATTTPHNYPPPPFSHFPGVPPNILVGGHVIDREHDGGDRFVGGSLGLEYAERYDDCNNENENKSAGDSKGGNVNFKRGRLIGGGEKWGDGVEQGQRV